MRVLCLIIVGLLPVLAFGAIDAYPFPDDEMRERYNSLIDELRCPQCLNTNLAGSDSMIANDLRREVHRLVLEGKSDDEVLDFMHSRYGDFILYDPQLKPGTWLLWFGPMILFIIALIVVHKVARQRGTIRELSDTELERIDTLTSKTNSDK